MSDRETAIEELEEIVSRFPEARRATRNAARQTGGPPDKDSTLAKAEFEIRGVLHALEEEDN